MIYNSCGTSNEISSFNIFNSFTRCGMPKLRYSELQVKIPSFQLYIANGKKCVCCVKTVDVYRSMPIFSLMFLFFLNRRLLYFQKRSFNFEGFILASQKVES